MFGYISGRGMYFLKNIIVMRATMSLLDRCNCMYFYCFNKKAIHGVKEVQNIDIWNLFFTTY